MKTKLNQQQASVESQNENVPSIGQNELFNQYVTPYLDYIRRLCIRFTGSRHYLDDNYNEVLFHLYRHIHTYNPECSSITTWIYIAALRYVSRLNKERHNLIKVDTDMEIPDVSWVYDVELSKTQEFLTGYKPLFNDDINWALGQLKPIYRNALLLHFAGYKIVDIKYMLDEQDVCDEAIRIRLLKAKEQMRKLIDKGGNRRRV
jgi:RNA polymerase sigma factor (sigma-70 family)